MTESPIPSPGDHQERAERIARLHAGRRRSSATSTKVLVVGASSTAVLGMIAGFGVVDRLAATDVPAAASVDVPVPDPLGAISPIVLRSSKSTRPEVIVVVVDENGKVIASSGDLDPAPAAPARVEVPVAVPVAVPAPVPAAPAAAPAPPQATTSGS